MRQSDSYLSDLFFNDHSQRNRNNVGNQKHIHTSEAPLNQQLWSHLFPPLISADFFYLYVWIQ